MREDTRFTPPLLSRLLAFVVTLLLFGTGGRGMNAFAALLRATVAQDTPADRQQVNAKQFDKFKNGRRLLPGQTRDIVSEPPVERPEDGAPNWSTMIRDQYCAADSVVFGTVMTSVSGLTDDGSFVFTNYDVTVEEVFAGEGRTAGSKIVVSRPGGTVHTRSGDITARLTDVGTLDVNRQYLLFLRVVNDTGTFLAEKGLSAFQIDGQSLRPLTIRHLPSEFTSGGAADLIAGTLRSLARSACAAPNGDR
jgi:hypothetical protein